MTRETLEERKKKLMEDPAYHSSTDLQLTELIKAKEEIENFEISTRAEIHFSGQENVEGFASLVNMFLRTMLMTSKNPCLINVDNVDTQ